MYNKKLDLIREVISNKEVLRLLKILPFYVWFLVWLGFITFYTEKNLSSDNTLFFDPKKVVEKTVDEKKVEFILKIETILNEWSCTKVNTTVNNNWFYLKDYFWDLDIESQDQIVEYIRFRVNNIEFSMKSCFSDWWDKLIESVK